jgi:integrase
MSSACVVSSKNWPGPKGVPLLTRLVRSDDIPGQDRGLPRPLTAEQDRLIQKELLRGDDRDSNALLLLRHTGMRIGECLDLPPDCLRRIGQDQWAIHVPRGKLRTERVVPVDAFVCRIVERLVRWGARSRAPATAFFSPVPSAA